MLENLRIGSSIRFIGIDGRVLFHEDQVSSTAMSIDASNWIAGTYLCFVEHEGKKQLIKVIKG